MEAQRLIFANIAAATIAAGPATAFAQTPASGETTLASRLPSLKALKEALHPLYASFSAERKKATDGLMGGSTGAL